MSYFYDSLCNSLLRWREWKKKQSSQSRKDTQEWMHMDERASVLPATGAVLLGLQNREITTSKWRNNCFEIEKSLWYLLRVSGVIEEGSTNFSHCSPLVFPHRAPDIFPKAVTATEPEVEGQKWVAKWEQKDDGVEVLSCLSSLSLFLSIFLSLNIFLAQDQLAPHLKMIAS